MSKSSEYYQEQCEEIEKYQDDELEELMEDGKSREEALEILLDKNEEARDEAMAPDILATEPEEYGERY